MINKYSISHYLRQTINCVLLYSLVSCTPIDNYMLGKDNTESPRNLTAIGEIKHKLQLQWQVIIGKVLPGQHLKLTPLVVKNIIYIADAKGQVQALQRTTGKVLWRVNLQQGLLSGPAYTSKVLAFGTSSPGVVVLSAIDGHVIWRAEVSNDVLGTPSIANNHVIVKTIDGRLYAFDLTTGVKSWALDHGSPHLILQASSSPIIVDDKIIVGFADGELAVVDLRSGRILWQRNIAYARGSSDVERLVDIDSDPIVRANTIYLASYHGDVSALSFIDGQVLWTKTASVYKNMSIDTTTLYMTDSNDIIWAIDLSQGLVRWKQPGLKYRGVTGPALMGGLLIVGDKMGVVHVIDKRTGVFTARTTLNSAIETIPVVSSDHVYLLTGDGQLNDLKVSAI